MTNLDKIKETLSSANSIVFGQEKMLRSIVSSVICDGHLLIEGMPGLAKTLSISTISKLLHLDFKRIQFTPDLLPSDLIGTKIYSQKTEEFKTKFGPIFTNVLLADEINRSPAKVQSALLEAMAEKQVTIGEQSYPLEKAFIVLATQNPVEQEGTYPLPEAQLDRFMMKMVTNYPSFESELKVLEPVNSKKALEAMLEFDTIEEIRDEIDRIHVSDVLKRSIVSISHSTRPGNEKFDQKYKNTILHGVSPRATIWLYRLAKVNAFFEKRDHVLPDDIMYSINDILGHRIALTYDAKIEGVELNSLIKEIGLANL
jgi:MoxR-like ATPase